MKPHATTIYRRTRLGGWSLLALLAGCAAPPPPAQPTLAPPLDANLHQPCPAGLPQGSRCVGGQDEAGAHWLLAVPPAWSGTLVVHAHGGPTLGPPKAERVSDDLQRWAVVLWAGHAWAGTSFRQGGVAVQAAAEDTERLRQLASRLLGQPRQTLLHGQSWGAGVAVRTAERFPTGYQAMLLTSGVLGGARRAYDFRLDLRVVYQALCHNHPRPDETQYPLWQGLPQGGKLSRAELSKRINDCTGVLLTPPQRSAEQQRRLTTLLAQADVNEETLVSHLSWATWHFQELVFTRLQGRNPFDNRTVRYRTPAGEADLNQRVERYAADPQAVAQLAADSNPSGQLKLPVLSLRGVRDPVAFVELDTVFAEVVGAAGKSNQLVQTWTDEAVHSHLSDAEYAAAIDGLRSWAEGGPRPTVNSLTQRCHAWLATLTGGCHWLPASYRPGRLEDRLAPR